MVLLGLVANIVTNVLARTTEGTVGTLALIAALAAAAFNMYWVYKLCRALDTTPWAYVVAMVIPIISLICLAVLNQQATKFLQANGVKVGLLGAKT
jgi:hypothetical protein